MEIKEVIAENERRKAKLPKAADPRTGAGCCGKRFEVMIGATKCYLPETILAEHRGNLSFLPKNELDMLRCRHDFEYWAWRCVKIRHKLSGELVAFTLNSAQRKVLEVIESDRLADKPLRIILLKARQWGASTLIQIYMAWIQCVLRDRWNSLICAHVKNTASAIRSMYSTFLNFYPGELWESDVKPAFKIYNGSPDTRIIAGRNSTVTIGSCRSREASRGLDCSMAHLSEVAYWGNGKDNGPEAYIQAVCSGIPLLPLTFIALESTANGAGNYFHREWLRSKSGKSDKRAIFVAWHEIEIYRSEVSDAESLWNELDEYERGLWDEGLTLEMIAWYHNKRKEMASDDSMKAEFPTNDAEAFVHSGASVFAPKMVEQMRSRCCEPLAVGEICGNKPTGYQAIEGVRFSPDSCGNLEIWSYPIPGREYVAAVDIGGRSESSDFSVIAVVDRSPGRIPEVVAQWRGHTDHDLLAWKAAAIGMHYNEALLVIESNTLETELGGASEYILRSLEESYPRLYYRPGAGSRRVGFHTNRTTKNLIITSLIGAVRDGTYIEKSRLACDEMTTYSQTESGGFAARQGCHDDILMTRAMALYVEPDGGSSRDEDDSSRVLLNLYLW